MDCAEFCRIVNGALSPTALAAEYSRVGAERGSKKAWTACDVAVALLGASLLLDDLDEEKSSQNFCKMPKS
jgi:hypothetical protein